MGERKTEITLSADYFGREDLRKAKVYAVLEDGRIFQLMDLRVRDGFWALPVTQAGLTTSEDGPPRGS